MGRDVKVLPALPKVEGLLFKAVKGMLKRPGRLSALPDRALMVMNHTQSLLGLSRYAGVTGFTLRDSVPATWPFAQSDATSEPASSRSATDPNVPAACSPGPSRSSGWRP